MDQQSYWSFENEIKISYKDCNGRNTKEITTQDRV